MRHTRLFRLLLGTALALASIGAFAQVSGTKNIPGDYATLAAAITDVNGNGVGAGGVTLNLLAGNPQTTPVGGYSITATGTVADPIAITCNGNTITAFTPQTPGALNDAIFKLIGADYVTIDGCSMTENAANTTAVAGSNNMTEWGIALLYASTTDGAQNATLQGNTITLNRTYQNTFGIYSNSTHSATTVGTSATATTAAGGNSGLKIYGNTISNTNIGIIVIGPQAAADHNEGVDIGGVALATGNSISNYGTTGTFSSYANVSGTVNGILVRNTRNFNVSYNTITSSVGGVTAGTLNGIQIPAASNAPTGTMSNSINNNSISLRSGVAGGATNGINVAATTSTLTSTVSINNNDFNNFGHTVAGTAAITFIAYGSPSLNQTINNNTFTNMSVNTIGTVTFISIGTVPVPATGSMQVNGNAIVTGFAKTSAGGNVVFYTNNASPVQGAVASISNNVISNITVTGATGFTGIGSTDGASGSNGPTKTISGNVVSAISGGAGAMTPMTVNFSGPGSVISANTINNISWGAGVTALALGSSNQATTATQNTINTILTTAGTVTGISTATPTASVTRNKIYDLQSTNATGSVNGVLVSAGTSVTLTNNLIGDLRAPSTSAVNAVVGINVTGGTSVNVAFNSVLLQASSIGADFGSSALSASSTPTLTLNNNVLVNLSTAAGTGLTAAYRRTTATLTSYAAASNNNAFHAGAASASNLIFTDGTNSDQTLAAYKARVAGRDSASVTENPPFLSTTGASATFLHVDPAVATQLESGAAPFAGVSVDYDGDARHPSAPDIGADEFTGVLLDVNGPAITYTALSSTTQTSNRTLTATISDPSGVASGSNAPRTYFRKNAGSYFSTPCTGAGPAFTCTIDNALLGGVAAPDVIDYFVIAQDTVGNISANPAAGLVATDVNTVTTPPTTPNSYSIVAPFPAAVNVGSGETYTSLTNAGGLFEALNNGVLTTNVTVSLTSDLSAETGAVALNARAEEPVASNFTLRISPTGAARVITGSFNGALIRINGSNRTTIDGSLGGVGTDRSLTISNASITGPTVVAFGSVGTTPIADVALKNSIIINGANTSSAVVISDATVGNSGYFDTVTIQNNSIQNAFIGVYANGGTIPQNGANLVYSQNSLDTAGASAIRLVGLYMQGVNGATVSDNVIGNFDPAAGENDIGIWLATGSVNATVSGNVVSTLGYSGTGAFAPIGINVTSGASPANVNVSGNEVLNIATNGTAQVRGIQVGGTVSDVTVQKNKVIGVLNTNTATYGAYGIDISAGNNMIVANNFVSGINHDMTGGGAFSTTYGVFGLRVGTGIGHKIYHNSVNLSGATPGTPNSGLLSAAFAMVSTTSTGCDVRNNIFANNITGGTTGNAHVSAYLPAGGSAAMNLTWNNNAYYFGADAAAQGAGQSGVVAGTAFFVTLPDLTAYTSTLSAGGANDNASVAFTTTVPFVSATDLHLQLALPVSTGASIPSVTTDIDNDPRPALAPAMGADELPSYTVGGNVSGLTGSGLVLRNNGGDDLPIVANGTFTFDSPVATGATYAVTVLTQPGSPAQTCAISNANGTVTNANITDVLVTCGLDNTAPTIAAVATNRRAGDAISNSTIANVGDVEDASQTLIVTVGGGASASSNGVTVSSIVSSVTGVVTADVVASCTATGATFGLRVTDSGGLFNDAVLTVVVDANLPPTLSYNPSNAVFGQSLGVNAASGPSDSGSVSSVAVQSPGTYTGGVSVNAAGVVSLTNAGPVAAHTIVIRATDNCAATTDANLALTVGTAATTTAITSDAPDPSFAGQNVVVNYTVAVTAPGAGTPAGNVTVSDGVDSCTATVTAGQCTLALSTPGARTLTATYAGNSNFATSAGTAAHTVSPTADLSITKAATEGLMDSGIIQYTITAANAGPSAVTGATVTDTFTAQLAGAVWTCTSTLGGTCPANGTGNISQLVNLPVGATAVFSVTANIVLPLPGSISNTATIAVPAGTTDPNLANNSASVTTVILLFADGFEDVVPMMPDVLKLGSSASPGAWSGMALPLTQIEALANGTVPGEVIRFQVQDSLIVVQARGLGGVLETRLVQINAPGQWSVSGWTAIDPQTRGLSFDWSATDGVLPQARLRSVR